MISSSQTYLDEIAAKALLRDYGIATPNGIRIDEEKIDFSELDQLRGPWAVKILSQDIKHKSDGGYVALSLGDTAQVETEIRRMKSLANESGHRIDGFLVEEMAAPGIEVIVGGFVDACFGPAVMFGIGGVFVEVLRDVTFRVCPLTCFDAEEMIDELAGRQVFDRVRGGVSVERQTLVDLILAVGGEDGIMLDHEEPIVEIDLNPVIVRDNSATAVDAFVVLDAKVRKHECP